MNRIFKIFFFILLTLLQFSCGKDDDSIITYYPDYEDITYDISGFEITGNTYKDKPILDGSYDAYAESFTKVIKDQVTLPDIFIIDSIQVNGDSTKLFARRKGFIYPFSTDEIKSNKNNSLVCFDGENFILQFHIIDIIVGNYTSTYMECTDRDVLIKLFINENKTLIKDKDAFAYIKHELKYKKG